MKHTALNLKHIFFAEGATARIQRLQVNDSLTYEQQITNISSCSVQTKLI